MSESRLKRGLRATFMGLGVNAVMAGGKLSAGILGHSHALIADAVESLVDVFSSLVVWRGLVVAATPADEDHPYGHGKAEPLAAATVSATLLLAAGWICLRAIEGMLRPHEAPAPFTLIVLITAILTKEGLFRYVQRESVSLDSSAMRTDAWHHRSDAITSLAAAVGISVSLIGGKNYAIADDIAAIVAAGIIARNGWHLLHPALHELMDSSPSREIVDQIRQVASLTTGVEHVEKCLVRKMGYGFYVDMHVQVDPQMTVQRSHEIAHEVKNRVRSQVPAVLDVLVHIEPASRLKRESPDEKR